MLPRLLCLIISLIFITSARADTASGIDQTEVTIGAFAEFVAATGFRTKAEETGGMVYEAGWVVKPDWNWRQPYGIASPPEEPAVHITFDEAMTYCNWRGQRLPNRDEWIRAAIPSYVLIHQRRFGVA